MSTKSFNDVQLNEKSKKFTSQIGHFGVISKSENRTISNCPNNSETGVRFDRN